MHAARHRRRRVLGGLGVAARHARSPHGLLEQRQVPRIAQRKLLERNQVDTVRAALDLGEEK